MEKEDRYIVLIDKNFYGVYKKDMRVVKLIRLRRITWIKNYLKKQRTYLRITID